MAANFSLSRRFLRNYKKLQPEFGYQGLGELVYRRTYSRNIGGDINEEWHQTMERVVNGTMNMERRHVQENGNSWDTSERTDFAQAMYDRMFHMKFLPGGRGLSAMGSRVIEERGVNAALNNCAFVSTKDIGVDELATKPFAFLMDMSMCGVGVGFDTLGEGRRTIRVATVPLAEEVFTVPDSREGWVQSLVVLLDHYFFGTALPKFDYSLVRAEGEPIRGFGGISGGPAPLVKMHELIVSTLDPRRGFAVTITDIVDIMNIIGKCVVSGNVRRTAEIAFGPNTPEFLDLKNSEVNPHRAPFKWTSNNSITASLGMDYNDIAERIKINGEPGVIWLDNIHRYGRMREPQDEVYDRRSDDLALGTNPCGEQPLENYELCCLVEVFPQSHDTIDDFMCTLELAYKYAKIITLADIHWKESAEVMRKNRRIGVSLSGIAQFITARGQAELQTWCEQGYAHIRSLDAAYSKYLKVNESIRVTTIKPSGTVSLLAGATPGLHYPIAPYYIRRVRLADTSPYVSVLRDAGYLIETAKEGTGTLIVEFPAFSGNASIRSEDEVSMFEQLELAAFLQRHWSDNAVSVTVKFNPETEGPDIAEAFKLFEKRLKGVAFLPNIKGVYDQMPYEAIDKEQYELLLSALKPIVWSEEFEPKEHVYCDSEGCSVLSPFR